MAQQFKNIAKPDLKHISHLTTSSTNQDCLNK